MSPAISAIWVSRNSRPDVRPDLFKGVVTERTADNGGDVTLRLSQVKIYTWANYHGKLIRTDMPEEDVLWRAQEDVVFDNVVRAQQDKPGEIVYTRESDGLRVRIVQTIAVAS